LRPPRKPILIISLLIILSAGSLLSSCMPPTKAVSRENSMKREVINVLLAMQTAYEKEKIDEFMVWVHDKYPKRVKFRKKVLEDFSSSRDIHLSIVIDEILVGDKGADLKVHWYRTWIPLPGNQVIKKEGKARLLFSLNPVRLFVQKGDKPFGPPELEE